MHEVFVEGRGKVQVGSFSEINKPETGLTLNSVLDIIVHDPQNGTYFIERRLLKGFNGNEVELSTSGIAFTYKISPTLEIFLLATLNNYPVKQ